MKLLVIVHWKNVKGNFSISIAALSKRIFCSCGTFFNGFVLKLVSLCSSGCPGTHCCRLSYLWIHRDLCHPSAGIKGLSLPSPATWNILGPVHSKTKSSLKLCLAIKHLKYFCKTKGQILNFNFSSFTQSYMSIIKTVQLWSTLKRNTQTLIHILLSI